MSLLRTLIVTGGLLSFGAGAWAQTPAPGTAGAIKALSACRAETKDAARLACYDRAAAGLLDAERAGEVVVVDRAQANAARRQAFGFNLPSLNFLSQGARSPKLDRVELTLARVTTAPGGKLILRTEDGQVWRQTDTVSLGSPPRRGSKLVVRSAVLGSYFMNIDGQTAIRVRREQ